MIDATSEEEEDLLKEVASLAPTGVFGSSPKCFYLGCSQFFVKYSALETKQAQHGLYLDEGHRVNCNR